jgi:predicted site-specific integrase-resolvase
VTGRPLLSLKKFNELVGVSSVTTWRWRRSGWLATVNIAGRLYLTDQGLRDFLQRAEAGDLAKEPKVPRPVH